MTNLFSLFGSALFFMALCFAVLQVKRWGKAWPVAYLLVSVLLIIPVNHWLIVEFVRGYVSDLSMATLFICALYLWRVVRPSADKVQPSLYWFVIVLALFLYPMSMGLTQFDPFTLGYSSNELYPVMLLVLVFVGLVTWFIGLKNIAVVIAMAVLANGLQLYESQNLWVYLIDPIAVIMSFVSVVLQGCIMLFTRLKTLGVKDV